jgi:Trk-type K+ transport system membrane component
MFVGRLGPLTIVCFIGSPRKEDHIHYPEEEVVVG